MRAYLKIRVGVALVLLGGLAHAQGSVPPIVDLDPMMAWGDEIPTDPWTGWRGADVGQGREAWPQGGGYTWTDTIHDPVFGYLFPLTYWVPEEEDVYKRVTRRKRVSHKGSPRLRPKTPPKPKYLPGAVEGLQGSLSPVPLHYNSWSPGDRAAIDPFWWWDEPDDTDLGQTYQWVDGWSPVDPQSTEIDQPIIGLSFTAGATGPWTPWRPEPEPDVDVLPLTRVGKCR